MIGEGSDSIKEIELARKYMENVSGLDKGKYKETITTKLITHNLIGINKITGEEINRKEEEFLCNSH